MPPHQQWPDLQPVQFNGQVIAATYGPAGQPLQTHHNVTQQVQALQQRGQNMVMGGIHTAVGDPAPGVPKVFSVWYAAQPNQQWPDLQPVQFAGQVVAATYGPAGTFQSATQQVQALQQRGQNMVMGGIHTAIGDPNPGVPKVFSVWYY